MDDAAGVVDWQATTLSRNRAHVLLSVRKVAVKDENRLTGCRARPTFGS